MFYIFSFYYRKIYKHFTNAIYYYITKGVREFAYIMSILHTLFGGNTFEQIDVHELQNILTTRKEEFQYIDVRTPSEYSSHRIKNFKNIPLDTLPTKLSTFHKSKATIVICQSGMRSSRACSLLAANGIQVINVKGGMNAWQQL